MKKRFLIAVAVLLQAACTPCFSQAFRVTRVELRAPAASDLPNACLILAVRCYEALPAQNWRRVLVLKRPGHAWHAVCAYEFAGQLFAYDPNSGSTPISRQLALKTRPLSLARAWRADAEEARFL